MNESYPLPNDEGVSYRNIPGFPDTYLVGDDGSVWTCIVRGSKAGRRGPWWRMKTPLSNGYPVANLRTHGRTVLMPVHKMVLLAFVGPKPEGHVCRHLDGNPLNSHLGNLAWGTPAENSADQLRHGTRRRGSQRKGHILTEDQVVVIKRRLLAGESQTVLAREYGVHPNTVRSIYTGQSWAWLDVQSSQWT